MLIRATGLQTLAKFPLICRRMMHAMMTPLELPGTHVRIAA